MRECKTDLSPEAVVSSTGAELCVEAGGRERDGAAAFRILVPREAVEPSRESECGLCVAARARGLGHRGMAGRG